MIDPYGILHLTIHPISSVRGGDESTTIRSALRRLFKETEPNPNIISLGMFDVTNVKMVYDDMVMVRIVHRGIVDDAMLRGPRLLETYQALRCCSQAVREGGQEAYEREFPSDTVFPRGHMTTDWAAATPLKIPYEPEDGTDLAVSSSSTSGLYAIFLELPGYDTSPNEMILTDAIVLVGKAIQSSTDLEDPLSHLNVTGALIRHGFDKAPLVSIHVNPDGALLTACEDMDEAEFKISQVATLPTKWTTKEWSPSPKDLRNILSISSRKILRARGDGREVVATDAANIELPAVRSALLAAATRQLMTHPGMSIVKVVVVVSLGAGISGVVMPSLLSIVVFVTCLLIGLAGLRSARTRRRTRRRQVARSRQLPQQAARERPQLSSSTRDAWAEIAILVKRHRPELVKELHLAQQRCVTIVNRRADSLDLEVHATLAMIDGDIPELLGQAKRPLAIAKQAEAAEIVGNLVSALTLIGERAEEARERLMREASIGFDDHVKYITQRARPDDADWTTPNQ